MANDAPPLPLAVPAGTAAGPVTIAGKVRYQLCDDKVCFMPVTPPACTEVTRA